LSGEVVENTLVMNDDGTRRLSDMETLLRRLHRSRTPSDAAEIVRRLLPGVIGGGDAALFAVSADNAVGVHGVNSELWPIAKECATSGQVCRSEDNCTVAVPVPGTGAIVLRSPQRITPTEARLLELFGQHAAAALRPARLSASA